MKHPRLVRLIALFGGVLAGLVLAVGLLVLRERHWHSKPFPNPSDVDRYIESYRSEESPEERQRLVAKLLTWMSDPEARQLGFAVRSTERLAILYRSNHDEAILDAFLGVFDHSGAILPDIICMAFEVMADDGQFLDYARSHPDAREVLKDCALCGFTKLAPPADR